VNVSCVLWPEWETSVPMGPLRNPETLQREQKGEDRRNHDGLGIIHDGVAVGTPTRVTPTPKLSTTDRKQTVGR
jgi:hypothetical protein